MQDKPFAPNWKRNASFFIAGQFLSMFGSMLVSYAITWHITLQEQSGSLVAIFACAALLPMVAISPFAGVWADRYNRKYLINISDAAIAVITLVVAILYMSGIQDIWMLFVAVIARSFGQGVQQPAVTALIPQIVPPEHLVRFNGIQSTVQSLNMFGAPMVAGALLTFLPLEYIFFIDVGTAIIGIATVFFFVKVGGVPDAEERKPGAKAYFHEMMEGLRFIKSQPWLKTILVFTAIFCILASPAAMLTPLQVARSFGDDVWRLTAIEIAFSGGMMVGGILIAVWGGFKNKIHTVILALVVFGVTTVLFGIIPNFWVYLAVMVLCGCGMPCFNTPVMTLMQMKIPMNIMGRVFSVLAMINGVAMPIGIAVFGPLGDVIKIEYVLIVTGILLVFGSLVLCSRKELLAVGTYVPEPGEAALEAAAAAETEELAQ